MATITLNSPRMPPRDKLLSIADVATMPTFSPSGDVSYELDNGRLVIMAPPGDLHGSIQCNLSMELKLQGERRKLGKARAEVGVIL